MAPINNNPNQPLSTSIIRLLYQGRGRIGRGDISQLGPTGQRMQRYFYYFDTNHDGFIGQGDRIYTDVIANPSNVNEGYINNVIGEGLLNDFLGL